MAFLFDEQYDPMTQEDAEFGVIPIGTYRAIVSAASIEETNAKTGHYIKLELEIVEGDYKGRKVWTMFNHDNPNPKAVDIAMKQFGKFCQSINVRIQKEEDLPQALNKVCFVELGQEEYNDKPKNTVKKFISPTNSSSTTSSAVDSSGKKQPWKK